MSDNEDYTPLLGAMLRIPFQEIVARIDAGLRARGYQDLRPAHFMIFQHMRQGGLRVTELAELAQVTKQSMGELVITVEACGYIERVPDPNDHRAKIIQLTPKGKALNAAAREILLQTEAEWAQQIGPGRMSALKQSLQAIIAVIENHR